MSTMLFLGLSPALRRAFWSHRGEGPIFTPLIIRAANLGQFSPSSTVTERCFPTGSADSFSFTRGSLGSVPVRTAISRATPMWLSQSGRFGVISRSNATSSSPKYEASVSPGFASLSRTMIPAESFPMSSSDSEQIIPEDSTPRIATRERTKGAPDGSC
jgi:hypothetical protein